MKRRECRLRKRKGETNGEYQDRKAAWYQNETMNRLSKDCGCTSHVEHVRTGRITIVTIGKGLDDEANRA